MTAAFRFSCVLSAALIAVAGPGLADNYRRDAQILIDAANVKFRTAGLRTLIWHIEEKERCAMRLHYRETEWNRRKLYERYTVAIPLGAIDPETIEESIFGGVHFTARGGDEAFLKTHADPAGSPVSSASLDLRIHRDASFDEVVAAIKNLAETCR